MNTSSEPTPTIPPPRDPVRRRSLVAAGVIIVLAALGFATLVAKELYTFLAFWWLLIFAPILLLTWLASWREATGQR